jgi:outer membrane protein assembly factor BamB/dienelactone hydrolase
MPRTRITPLVNAFFLASVVVLGGLQRGHTQEIATPGAATEPAMTAGDGLIGPPDMLWMTPLGMAPVYDQPTPGVGEGLVVTSGPTGLVAVDAATGAERWRVEQPVSASSPLVQDGKVFVGTAGQGVKAFDARTGDEVWQYLTGDTAVPDNAPPDSVDSSPIIADGVLYIGEGGYGGLSALDPATGAEHWRFDTHGATWASATVADGTVYIASDAVFDVDQEDPAPSALYAVDAATGKERWHMAFETGENSFSTPAVANGTVVVGVTNPDANTGYYLAADATTGDERWRFALDKAPWEASPGADGDLAYLTGGDDPALIAVDAATGEEQWRYTTEMALYAMPVVAENVLYFQSQDGHMTALDPVTGAEFWQAQLGWGGAPVVADGTLYASGYGNLFALGSAGDANAVSLASQPAPPTTGPGSEDTLFPAARVTRYGSEPGGYLIWEPPEWAAPDAPPAAGPFPVIVFFSGCCGNGTYPTPEEVDPWMQHLARQGYVIIAPVFHHGTPVEDSQVLLRLALDELGQDGHSRIDPSQSAAIGFSYGGTTSVLYAAAAEEAGLPVPQALFLTAPCGDNGFCLSFPEDPLVMPAGMKAVAIGYGDDHVVGLEQPESVFALLSSLPAEDRDFVAMTTDGHGLPAIYGGHDTTYNQVDAADRYALWKLSDALFACTFHGEFCDVALGNTPEQRFMGTWSDGVPVTELQVTDGPTIPEDAATPVGATPTP